MGATSSSPTPALALPSSRTVIVTGGNTGIGYETAKAIAQMGARVIIACRSEERAKEAIEKMQKEYNQKIENKDPSAVEAEKKHEKDGELDSSHQLLVEYMHLDLTSLSSTGEFVKAFKQTGYPLHVLICNAGMAFVNQALTGDGFETHFQVNYLSHLLLVLNLLSVMTQSVPDVRVVFVSSQMEKWAGDFNLDNIQGQQSFDRTKFYSNSKLYMIMVMYYLHRCLASKEMTFCALHPGVVSTEITRNFQDFTLMNLGFRIYKALGMAKTPQEGAKTTINCAVNPELAGVSGAYYINCRSTQPSQLARNKKEQEKLWNYSIECLKGFIDENILSEFGLNVTSLEDQQLSAKD